MRPLRLEMEGLRSYRMRVKLDFSDCDLLAIVGDTGSGKSSILEALVFALYNGTTWGGRDTKSLISGDGDGVMSVVLEFQADGRLWRVSRRISESSSPGSLHRLECLSPGEEGSDTLNSATQVDNKIEELIGLKREAFITSVILPQGRFQELLHASDTEKTRILKGIFRLDAIDSVRSRAQRRVEVEREQEVSLLEEKTNYMPEPRHTLDAATESVRRLAPELEVTTARLASAREAQEKLQQIGREREHYQGRDAELRDADSRTREISEELTSLSEFEAKYAGLDDKLNHNIARTSEELREAREALESITTAANTETLSAALERANGLPEKLEELRGLDAQIEERSAGLEKINEELAGAEANAEQASATAEKRREEYQIAERARQSVADAVRRVARYQQDLRREREEHERVTDDLTRARAGLDAAIQETGVQQDHLSAAETHRVSCLRDDAGLEVAAMAVPGEPCPVCERELPPTFSGASQAERDVRKERLEEAEAALMKIRHNVEGAQAEEHRLHERAGSLQDQKERRARSVEDLENELDVAVSELAQTGAVTQAETSLPEDLDAESSERSANEAAESARQAQDAAARAEHECRTVLYRLQSDREREELALGANRERRTMQERQLRERFEALPEFAISSVWQRLNTGQLALTGVSATDLTGVAEAIGARLDEIREAQQLERNLVEKRDSQQRELSDIQQRREKELLAPKRRLASSLHDPYAIIRADVADLPAVPDSEEPISDLVGYAQALIEKMQAELEVTTTKLTELVESEQTNTNTLTLSLAEAMCESLGELQRHKDEQEYELRSARNDRERAERELPEVERIEGELEQCRHRRDVYKELHALLAPGRFGNYATERRQIQLLGVASDIFKEMTEGAYGFAANFEVMHDPTGQQRDGKTLSGGETFLASLSLALGLMEIASRSGGRLEAFFLDEGFGSLDPNALDRALVELERRSRNGRLVAMVSHVPEVADYIRGHGAVLRVRRDETGSSVAEFDGLSDSGTPRPAANTE